MLCESTRHLLASGAARPIADLIEPVVEETGFRLVRVVLGGGSGGGRRLQVMAERADGSMNLEDCTMLSRRLSEFLDERDPIEGSYALEVSSPGLSRPLSRLEDFDKWRGSVARIELREAVDGHRRLRGRLSGVENESVSIEVEASQVVSIPASIISRACLLEESATSGEKR